MRKKDDVRQGSSSGGVREPVAPESISQNEPRSASGNRSQFLSGRQIELLRTDCIRGRFRAVLFDFDGTLSLIREGWPEVMIPMMVRVLRDTGTKETDEQLDQHVEEFVMRLNGRQTIYQMIQLAEEVRQRGGRPRDPLEYKHEYHELLMKRSEPRLKGLRDGTISPETMTVPGSHQFLRRLRQMGLTLYLASGTDLKHVREEAALLRLTEYFGDHIYGAVDDYKNFSKRLVVERILQQHGLQGPELLAFGDGFVEIEEVKKAGGLAVGVASDEVRRAGVNAWKRDRLIRAGADLIIAEYRQQEALLAFLFGGDEKLASSSITEDR